MNHYDQQKLRRHDSLIHRLYKRLEHSPVDYDMIVNNKHYPRGELDLVAVKGDRVLVFEMKCNGREKLYSKAQQQLTRARDLCDHTHGYDFHGFVVYYNSPIGHDYTIERLV